jgi:hypothetical protein
MVPALRHAAPEIPPCCDNQYTPPPYPNASRRPIADRRAVHLSSTVISAFGHTLKRDQHVPTKSKQKHHQCRSKRELVGMSLVRPRIPDNS